MTLTLRIIGKRSQQTAALESGSNVVPREMSRLHSGQVSSLMMMMMMMICDHITVGRRAAGHSKLQRADARA